MRVNVDTYPVVPNPVTVEVRLAKETPVPLDPEIPCPFSTRVPELTANTCLDESLISKNVIVDVNKFCVLRLNELNVLTYPAVPNPATVDVKFADDKNPEVIKACVVDTKDSEDTYPILPNPVTVEVKTCVDKKPAV